VNSLIATAEAVSAAGATARFVDVNPISARPAAVIGERALNPRVYGVIPVHLYEARGIASAVHDPVAIHAPKRTRTLGYPPGSQPVAAEMAEQLLLRADPGQSDAQIGGIAAAVAEVTRR
jgi:DegT/DnrJ/EryC1/StrS aminotransferase family